MTRQELKKFLVEHLDNSIVCFDDNGITHALITREELGFQREYSLTEMLELLKLPKAVMDMNLKLAKLHTFKEAARKLEEEIALLSQGTN